MPERQRGIQRLVKVAVDRLLAAVLLIATAPLAAAVALLLRLSIGSPVLFRQQRPGLHGRPFMLIKFRTMTSATDERGELLPDERRLTRIGSLVRRLSLDELPQLWNVLRGDISFVGPRPLLMEYLPLYSPEQMRRHDVLPGLSGWAQVNGRNALSWEERFALDVWYVDHWSLALDARIFFLTIAALLRRSGVSHPGHVTMPRFRGGSDGARE